MAQAAGQDGRNYINQPWIEKDILKNLPVAQSQNFEGNLFVARIIISENQEHFLEDGLHRVPAMFSISSSCNDSSIGMNENQIQNGTTIKVYEHSYSIIKTKDGAFQFVICVDRWELLVGCIPYSMKNLANINSIEAVKICLQACLDSAMQGIDSASQSQIDSQNLSALARLANLASSGSQSQQQKGMSLLNRSGNSSEMETTRSSFFAAESSNQKLNANIYPSTSAVASHGQQSQVIIARERSFAVKNVCHQSPALGPNNTHGVSDLSQHTLQQTPSSAGKCLLREITREQLLPEQSFSPTQLLEIMGEDTQQQNGGDPTNSLESKVCSGEAEKLGPISNQKSPSFFTNTPQELKTPTMQDLLVPLDQRLVLMQLQGWTSSDITSTDTSSSLSPSLSLSQKTSSSYGLFSKPTVKETNMSRKVLLKFSSVSAREHPTKNLAQEDCAANTDISNSKISLGLNGCSDIGSVDIQLGKSGRLVSVKMEQRKSGGQSSVQSESRKGGGQSNVQIEQKKSAGQSGVQSEQRKSSKEGIVQIEQRKSGGQNSVKTEQRKSCCQSSAQKEQIENCVQCSVKRYNLGQSKVRLDLPNSIEQNNKQTNVSSASLFSGGENDFSGTFDSFNLSNKSIEHSNLQRQDDCFNFNYYDSNHSYKLMQKRNFSNSTESERKNLSDSVESDKINLPDLSDKNSQKKKVFDSTECDTNLQKRKISESTKHDKSSLKRKILESTKCDKTSQKRKILKSTKCDKNSQKRKILESTKCDKNSRKRKVLESTKHDKNSQKRKVFDSTNGGSKILPKGKMLESNKRDQMLSPNDTYLAEVSNKSLVKKHRLLKLEKVQFIEISSSQGDSNTTNSDMPIVKNKPWLKASMQELDINIRRDNTSCSVSGRKQQKEIGKICSCDGVVNNERSSESSWMSDVHGPAGRSDPVKAVVSGTKGLLSENLYMIAGHDVGSSTKVSSTGCETFSTCCSSSESNEITPTLPSCQTVTQVELAAPESSIYQVSEDHRSTEKQVIQNCQTYHQILPCIKTTSPEITIATSKQHGDGSHDSCRLHSVTQTSELIKGQVSKYVGNKLPGARRSTPVSVSHRIFSPNTMQTIEYLAGEIFKEIERKKAHASKESQPTNRPVSADNAYTTLNETPKTGEACTFLRGVPRKNGLHTSFKGIPKKNGSDSCLKDIPRKDNAHPLGESSRKDDLNSLNESSRNDASHISLSESSSKLIHSLVSPAPVVTSETCCPSPLVSACSMYDAIKSSERRRLPAVTDDISNHCSTSGRRRNLKPSSSHRKVQDKRHLNSRSLKTQSISRSRSVKRQSVIRSRSLKRHPASPSKTLRMQSSSQNESVKRHSTSTSKSLRRQSHNSMYDDVKKGLRQSLNKSQINISDSDKSRHYPRGSKTNLTSPNIQELTSPGMCEMPSARKHKQIKGSRQQNPRRSLRRQTFTERSDVVTGERRQSRSGSQGQVHESEIRYDPGHLRLQTFQKVMVTSFCTDTKVQEIIHKTNTLKRQVHNQTMVVNRERRKSQSKDDYHVSDNHSPCPTKGRQKKQTPSRINEPFQGKRLCNLRRSLKRKTKENIQKCRGSEDNLPEKQLSVCTQGSKANLPKKQLSVCIFEVKQTDPNVLEIKELLETKEITDDKRPQKKPTPQPSCQQSHIVDDTGSDRCMQVERIQGCKVAETRFSRCAGLSMPRTGESVTADCESTKITLPRGDHKTSIELLQTPPSDYQLQGGPYASSQAKRLRTDNTSRQITSCHYNKYQTPMESFSSSISACQIHGGPGDSSLLTSPLTSIDSGTRDEEGNTGPRTSKSREYLAGSQNMVTDLSKSWLSMQADKDLSESCPSQQVDKNLSESWPPQNMDKNLLESWFCKQVDKDLSGSLGFVPTLVWSPESSTGFEPHSTEPSLRNSDIFSLLGNLEKSVTSLVNYVCDGSLLSSV